MLSPVADLCSASDRGTAHILYPTRWNCGGLDGPDGSFKYHLKNVFFQLCQNPFQFLCLWPLTCSSIWPRSLYGLWEGWEGSNSSGISQGDRERTALPWRAGVGVRGIESLWYGWRWYFGLLGQQGEVCGRWDLMLPPSWPWGWWTPKYWGRRVRTREDAPQGCACSCPYVHMPIGAILQDLHGDLVSIGYNFCNFLICI